MEARCSLQAWFEHVVIGGQGDQHDNDGGEHEQSLDRDGCWKGKHAQQWIGWPSRRFDEHKAVASHS